MGNPHGLAILEIVCSSFFTLEFLLRVIFCPTKLEFFEKPMNWIDLISILPFYVAYFYDDYKVKMFLVIRVLRLFRYVIKQGKKWWRSHWVHGCSSQALSWNCGSFTFSALNNARTLNFVGWIKMKSEGLWTNRLSAHESCVQTASSHAQFRALIQAVVQVPGAPGQFAVRVLTKKLGWHWYPQVNEPGHSAWVLSVNADIDIMSL